MGLLVKNCGAIGLVGVGTLAYGSGTAPPELSQRTFAGSLRVVSAPQYGFSVGPPTIDSWPPFPEGPAVDVSMLFKLPLPPLQVTAVFEDELT